MQLLAFSQTLVAAYNRSNVALKGTEEEETEPRPLTHLYPPIPESRPPHQPKLSACLHPARATKCALNPPNKFHHCKSTTTSIQLPIWIITIIIIIIGGILCLYLIVTFEPDGKCGEREQGNGVQQMSSKELNGGLAAEGIRTHVVCGLTIQALSHPTTTYFYIPHLQ